MTALGFGLGGLDMGLGLDNKRSTKIVVKNTKKWHALNYMDVSIVLIKYNDSNWEFGHGILHAYLLNVWVVDPLLPDHVGLPLFMLST